MSANIGKDLLDLFKKQRLQALVGLDDWADRLSYFYTVIILTVCSAVVTSKTYFFKPLACHVATAPGGSNFKSYFNEACLIKGTIPVRHNESLPDNEETWKRLESTMQMNYYYWIPFVLGMQMILFYLPNIIWRAINYNRLGINLLSLLEKATEARNTPNVQKRKEKSEEVANSMKLLLFDHRDNRDSVFADFQRLAAKMCGMLLFSKRLGTWTVASYLFIKSLYLANAIGQLYMMKKFLNFGDSMQNFGVELAKRITFRDDWRDSLYFPRTAICRMSFRLVGVSRSQYIGLCTLPINLFNEKIYVFLWFWMLYVAICTGISIPLWFTRLGIKSQRIGRMKKFFKVETVRFDVDIDQKNPSRMSPDDPEHIAQFIDEFLRYDGVFLIDIIYQHVGDIVTGEIVRLLWLSWTAEYAGRHDFRLDKWNDVNDGTSASEISSREVSSLLYPNVEQFSEASNQNSSGRSVTQKSQVV